MSTNLEYIIGQLYGNNIPAIKSKKNNKNAISFRCMQYDELLHIIEISDNQYQIVKYRKNETYKIEVQYLLSYNSDESMNTINTFNAEDIVNEAIQRAITYYDP